MPSQIEEIKGRIDLVELIQSYLRVHKAGANYKAVCPFHTEKTPSFFISPSRQIWHCFGCGAGGDAFKFVMELEGLDFPEALKMLAQRAGVVLRREDPNLRSEKNRLYEICEEATQIFEKNLTLTPAVRNYLKKRGVTDESIKDFRMGFAPQSWDFLLKTLLAKGFKKEEVEKAGLAVKSEDKSSWYDRFRSRIMFPIFDANSRVIGFGGRIFETGAQKKDEAKYVNTPATPIYDKSSVLYGFDKAKNEIRNKNQVVVVEGYMDCLMSQQAGVKNTIAVSGTALTPQQLTILRRLCNTLVSSFDTDAAGETATKRSLALASQFEFERKIAAIPTGKPGGTTLTAAKGGTEENVKVDIPGKDPADIVLINPELWIKAVAEAKPVVEYFFEKAFREKNPNHVNGKKEISAILLPYLAELSNEIEKSHWAGELSRRLEVSEESIWKELRRGAIRAGSEYIYTSPAPEKATKAIPTRRDLLEERLLTLYPIVQPEIRQKEFENHYLKFSSVLNEELFNFLQSGNEPLPLAPHLKERLQLLKFKGEILAQMTKDLEKDFISSKRELEKICLKEDLTHLGRKIETAEKSGAQTEVAALLQNFRELSNRLKNIENNTQPGLA